MLNWIFLMIIFFSAQGRARLVTLLRIWRSLLHQGLAQGRCVHQRKIARSQPLVNWRSSLPMQSSNSRGYSWRSKDVFLFGLFCFAALLEDEHSCVSKKYLQVQLRYCEWCAPHWTLRVGTSQSMKFKRKQAFVIWCEVRM